MHRSLALISGALVLAGGAEGLADPLVEQIAIESAQELASLAGSLDVAPPAEGGDPGETVDTVELANDLETLASDIEAGRPRGETFQLFREIALQRHRLAREAHEGKISMTEEELEIASLLFADLAAYFEDGGED